jgi:hypothetical protein
MAAQVDRRSYERGKQLRHFRIAGCSKGPSGKTAASEEVRRTFLCTSSL